MNYSHRNGETEPPTITGWYWLKQSRRSRQYKPDLSWLIFVWRGTEKIWRVDGNKEHYLLETIRGQWWGPVTMPWQANG